MHIQHLRGGGGGGVFPRWVILCMAHFAALNSLNCTWAIQLLLVSFQLGLEKEGSAIHVVVFYER